MFVVQTAIHPIFLQILDEFEKGKMLLVVIIQAVYTSVWQFSAQPSLAVLKITLRVHNDVHC